MSATNFRKMVTTNNGDRWIGVEYSGGKTVTLMIAAMSGWAPQLNLDEVRELIRALNGAERVLDDYA